MSTIQSPDPSRLEELRRRFADAAYNHPGLDALVVFRPDFRRLEAEQQARNFISHPHEAARCAAEINALIPPSDEILNMLGRQERWSHVVTNHLEKGPCGGPVLQELWECTVFGTSVRDIDDTALPLFNSLAPDAARLILCGNGQGKTSSRSGWLIHLADRVEPLCPGSGRRRLDWPMVDWSSSSLVWIPFRSTNPAPDWWAARLFNVFDVSRVAVEQAIGQVSTQTVGGPSQRADGPAGGRWLWWKNVQYKVPGGVVYRLLDYMWDRDSAHYDDLVDDHVFNTSVAPQTIRSYANKTNNELPAGFPWRLSTDSDNRQLTKVPRDKDA